IQPYRALLPKLEGWTRFLAEKTQTLLTRILKQQNIAKARLEATRDLVRADIIEKHGESAWYKDVPSLSTAAIRLQNAKERTEKLSVIQNDILEVKACLDTPLAVKAEVKSEITPDNKNTPWHAFFTSEEL